MDIKEGKSITDKVTEVLQKKQMEMEECNHLFIKLEEGRHYSGFHTSDDDYDPCVVICLKCGLTNQYRNVVPKIKKYKKFLNLHDLSWIKYFELNNEEFRKQFAHGWKRGGKAFDESVFSLISDEALYIDNPRELYNIARSIKPDVEGAELFSIMKVLHELGISEENLELQSIKQIQEFLDRYKGENIKVLKKTK